MEHKNIQEKGQKVIELLKRIKFYGSSRTVNREPYYQDKHITAKFDRDGNNGNIAYVTLHTMSEDGNKMLKYDRVFYAIKDADSYFVTIFREGKWINYLEKVTAEYEKTYFTPIDDSEYIQDETKIRNIEPFWTSKDK